MAENKKTLTVTQQVKELVYDIQNKAYLTGQAREAAGKSYQVASNMQAGKSSVSCPLKPSDSAPLC